MHLLGPPGEPPQPRHHPASSSSPYTCRNRSSLLPLPQAVLRPWKRTTDSRDEVTGATGGIDDGSDCAMSTPTAAAPHRVSSADVRSARSSSHQDGCRNSTATGHPRARSAHSWTNASPRAPARTHGGNWNSTEPSRPPRRNGAIPSANRAHTSSSTRGSRPSGGSPGGITALRVGCPVSNENALTSNTKPSGVRSTHKRLFRSEGSA